MKNSFLTDILRVTLLSSVQEGSIHENAFSYFIQESVPSVCIIRVFTTKGKYINPIDIFLENYLQTEKTYGPHFKMMIKSIIWSHLL